MKDNTFLWSVRREVWENRSVYVAPFAVAAIFLFGFMFSLIKLPRRMTAALALPVMQQRGAVELPFDMIAGLSVVAVFFVGFFYCLDALHGERRDRSILFWKSLPVSDRTTVLSKASIPLVVLPLISAAIVVITQTLMLMLSSIVLLGDSRTLTLFWTQLKFVQSFFCFLYCIVAIALWHAPVYAWLLLVSGWARRATFLWAVLPWLAICMFEGVAFRTSHFGKFLQYRLVGWFSEAVVESPKGTVPIDPLTSLTPGHFLATPALWIGLAFAAAFLAMAVRLRRNREPI